MSVLLEGDEQLERELTGEPVAAPAAGSVVLHAALAGAILLYGIIGGFFHSNVWGGAAAGGAIRVNLVSSALPLPSDQPPNQNVLATEKPSQAPVLPLPKATPTVDEKAIPILGKPKQEKPKPRPAPKTPPKQPPPRPDNRAQYGEQAASSMPRAVQGQTTTVGPTSVSEGDFGSKFPWYVDAINRKMSQSWNKFEVEPRTPKGARVFIVFTIHRDGSPTDVQLDRSSGSSTLDRSCIRGAQRVDTFGNLPSNYNSSSLKVSYYCEY
ncbi:MAG TPA: TonB family protein [Terracidiphilus sp.]|jgi:protein TonB